MKAEVYALSKTQTHLNSLKLECPNIHTICVDLNDWNKTKEVLSSEINEPMDGLVNNAGIILPAPTGLFEITPDDFDK